MTLSDGEKLILLMLCDLHKGLKIKNAEMEPDFVQETILNDHLWGFRWKYHGVPLSRQPDPPVVKEVADVLDMWWLLEVGYKRLKPVERAGVDKAVGGKVKFPGFDGNNETEHLSVARYFVDQLGRWEHFKNRDLNSHAPLLQSYKRMLQEWAPVRAALGNGNADAQTIIRVMNARRAP